MSVQHTNQQSGINCVESDLPVRYGTTKIWQPDAPEQTARSWIVGNK